jgi:cbb3-type cytochrome oxidase subunit 3
MQDAFESWQLIYPAVGLVIFFIVFLGVSFWATRMKRPSLDHLENLPLEKESPRPSSHVRPQ